MVVFFKKKNKMAACLAASYSRVVMMKVYLCPLKRAVLPVTVTN